MFGVQILTKNFKGAKIMPKTIFCHVFKFDSLAFLKIACNDNLQQFTPSSRGKIPKKKICETKCGPKQAKFRSKISFFVIFASLVYYRFCKMPKMIAWNNV